jgi:tRNA (cytidine/uridine-2'-O-)-methyltransferase
MHVILYRPQIPQNTGNVVRSCAVTGSRLTLIEPLGFTPTDRELKRAGLDYWLGVDVQTTPHLDPLLTEDFTFFSSKATRLYTEVSYSPNCTLIFGSETDGLPPHLHDQYADRFVTLPMVPDRRCLNLSTAVGIALYEAWRQNSFQ